MRKILLIVILYFLLSGEVGAAGLQGCCSHHKGVDYCSSSGRVVCNDGTYSPSCRCDSYDYSNYSYDNYDSYDYDYDNDYNYYGSTSVYSGYSNYNSYEDDDESEGILFSLISFGCIGYVIIKFFNK